MIGRRSGAVLTVLLGALTASVPGTASAKVAEPLVLSRAWYWEDQRELGGDVSNVGLPNPFCPSQSREETCKEGRLPVEVREGDYKTPNKLSAVSFDLVSIGILPGTKVKSFEVRFLEAEDEVSRPQMHNHENKKIQACLLEDFIGDGEARPYEEAPKYACSRSDPIATRREVEEGKGTRAEVHHVWTFDLTSFARRWAAEGSLTSGIVLAPVEPQKPAPQDRNWAVVFAGPQEKGGIETRLVYELPDLGGSFGGPGGPPPPPPSGGGGFTSPGGGGLTGPADSTGDFGSAGGGPPAGSVKATGSAGATGAGATAKKQKEAPEAKDLTTAVGAEENEPPAPSLPLYVWLAVLGGLLGIVAVRRAVFEGAPGPRPHGVLAQIRELNAEQRGAEIVPEGPSTGWDWFAGVVGATSARVRRLAALSGELSSKLRFRRS